LHLPFAHHCHEPSITAIRPENSKSLGLMTIGSNHWLRFGTCQPGRRQIVWFERCLSDLVAINSFFRHYQRAIEAATARRSPSLGRVTVMLDQCPRSRNKGCKPPFGLNDGYRVLVIGNAEPCVHNMLRILNGIASPASLPYLSGHNRIGHRNMRRRGW
jgi:hypothetical protein